MFDLFLSAFVSLFVVVDPIGTSAIFATLLSKSDAAEKKKIAIKAVVIAGVVVITFAIIGHWLLTYMSVSLSAFRVAGGLLLFVTAFRMIMGFHDPDQLDSQGSVYKDTSNLAVFPLAIPLLGGPGVMTAALMYMTESNAPLEYAVVGGTVVLVQLIALFCLLGAGSLSRLFGKTGNGIIARVMGILLAAMAVQFVADGIKELIAS
ncbi:MAG: MarC family protein [Pseudomonadota bacterium]|nr:MarC family protein [Pseudomonadota bacterium]MEC8664149.1 MarC family protein [Pseudomonadota bacterium]